MTRRLLLSIAGLLFVAACGGRPAQSEEPQPPPTACLGLDAADCRLVLEAVVGALGADARAATYIQAGPFYCNEGGCPPGLATRPTGSVTVELAGRDPVVFSAAAVGGDVSLTRLVETFVVPVKPSSGRLAGATTPYQLAHCGIFSGIDVDGSFWDPVGLVNADHSDAINSAEAVFTLTSPQTATLRTRGGLSLDLIRHDGVKHLPGCM